MNHRIILATASVVAAGAAALLVLPSGPRAADHTDSPAVVLAAGGAADIADLYAWTSADASKLNLVMTIDPFATEGAMFSDAVQYVFHVNSSGAFGEDQTETRILCTFTAAQAISCWVGDDEYVTGDAGGATGLASGSGRLRVFAGLRNDPFFFNINGFHSATMAVKAAAGGLTFDAEGCPDLDQPTADALVTQLASNQGGGDPLDAYAEAEILALVVQVDTALVTPGGPIAGIWASTHTRPQGAN